MADKKKDASAAAPAGKAPKKKGGGKLRLFTVLIVFGFVAPFILPTLLLAGLGLIPTFVALVIDRDPDRSSSAAIASMNAAGLAPFIIDLWVNGQNMPHAMHIMKEPMNWLVILGSAGIGQLIVFAVPAMMTNLTLLRAETRLKLLKSNLDQLKTGWGAEVATTKPVGQIVKD